MRICVITTSYPRSATDDAGIFIERMVLAFSKKGLSGMVIVPHDLREPLSETQAGFEIERVKYGLLTRGQLCFGAGIIPNLRAKPWLILQAPSLIISLVNAALRRASEFDLMHANWILAGVVAWFVSLRSKKPYVITLRGEDTRILKAWLLRPLFRRVLRGARAVTAVNRSLLEEPLSKFKLPTENLFTVPNGVEIPVITSAEIAAFATSNNLVADQRYLLFVGSVVPRKRVELLIELLARPRLRDYQLILCGRYEESYFRELIALAEKHECLNRIQWKGLVSPSEIPFYLKCATLYISASSHEGRPNAILEAFAAKLPVIASDIGPHREIINDGSNGFLVSPDNGAELEDRILKLQMSPELRSRITDNAYQMVASQSWSRCAQEYQVVFDAVLAAVEESRKE